MSDVTADLMSRAGLNIDHRVMDRGTAVQRRSGEDPVDEGGWSVLCPVAPVIDQPGPAVNAYYLRARGDPGTWGRPRSEPLEDLGRKRLDEQDVERRKLIAAEMQRPAFLDVPCIPLNRDFVRTVHLRDIDDVLTGWPVSRNVCRA